MKLSTHTIIVDDYPVKGEHLVYNTRTQALIKIDQPLKNLLDSLDKRNVFLDEGPVQEDLASLHRMGIIVESEQEDMAKLRQHLNQIKYSYDKSCYLVTILTTYGCNFKCTYCFEESSRTNVKLDFKTQNDVMDWIKRKVERLGHQGLYINYYGGEPLLNPDAIVHISKEMQEWCKQRGMEFSFGMQTNGYLMTPKRISQFKEYGLVRARISLDGVKEDHDRFRPLRGGGGTFDRIIKNIQDCVDLLEIGISVGYDQGNVEPVEKLLDYFDRIGLLDKLRGQFIFSPIIPTLGPKDNPQAIQGSECMCNYEDDKLTSTNKKINDLMKAKKLPTRSGMSTHTCPLVREHSGVTIDQEGRLYRCNSLLGHPEFAIGDIYHDEFNEKQKEFRDLDVWKQCPADCTYMPMCSGGCRLMSFVGGHKNFKVPSCKKPYLNKMAPEFIKREYQKMVSQRLKTQQMQPVAAN